MEEVLRISRENKFWQELLIQWDEECIEFGEDFGDYEQGTLSILRPLAEQTQRASSGVYAVKGEGGYLGMCQLNATWLPGYDGRVLRVRHIIHSPKFDYDDKITVNEYTEFLVSLFLGVFNISLSELDAPHIKFHFRSPAERNFFNHFKDALTHNKQFREVEMRGSWLYISKN